MEIRKIPTDYASLRSPLLYTVASDLSVTFDLRVIDHAANEVVGIKRFTGVKEATLDIAPYLRRCLRFDPRTGSTGFVSAAGRTVTARIEVGGSSSEPRTFLPGPTKTEVPSLITTLRGMRQIGRGECDELFLHTSTPCRIDITIRRNGRAEVTSYTAPTAGLNLFRLNTADFPGAENLNIGIAGVGSITYTFIDYKDGHRIAWRSSQGSIEHYTFPVAREETAAVSREQMSTDEGTKSIAVRTSRCVTLLSAYEPNRVLNPLAEILGSPEVWSIEQGIYTPIEIMNDTSGLRSHGTLRNLELRIRHQPQTLLP